MINDLSSSPYLAGSTLIYRRLYSKIYSSSICGRFPVLWAMLLGVPKRLGNPKPLDSPREAKIIPMILMVSGYSVSRNHNILVECVCFDRQWHDIIWDGIVYHEIWCDVTWKDTRLHNVTRPYMTWHHMTQHCMTWCDMICILLFSYMISMISYDGHTQVYNGVYT